jgi:hypothetical protein
VSIRFVQYTFREYTFREYTFREYTFREYTFREYTFREYTFCEYTFCKRIVHELVIPGKQTIIPEDSSSISCYLPAEQPLPPPDDS